MWPFSYFQYGLCLLKKTENLLRVVSNRIATAFNSSGAAQAVALDISNAFDKVSHAGLFHKLKSYRVSGQIFCLILSFLTNKQFQNVLNGKSS